MTRLRAFRLALLCITSVPGLAAAQPEPPPVVATIARVDCTRVVDTIQRAICADSNLIALDSSMVALYTNASRFVSAAQLQQIIAQQRNFLLDRESCGRQEYTSECIRQMYLRRNDLLARYASGAVPQPRSRYACQDGSTVDVTITPGDPELAKVTYGTFEWILPHVSTATGARYYLTGTSVWIKGYDVLFEHNGLPLNCKLPQQR